MRSLINERFVLISMSTISIVLILFSLLQLTGVVSEISPVVYLVVGAIVAAAGYFISRGVKEHEEWSIWLEGTLDAVPQPLTVTDLNMKWKFINKTTETLLNKSRNEVKGRHCSEWGADICNTENCGVHCLRSGKPRTHYNQIMPDGTYRIMQVDTSYIKSKGKRIGHVEIVTDVDAQYELGVLHERLSSSLEELASSIEEIDSQASMNASNAKATDDIVSETKEMMETGQQNMKRLDEAMARISESSKGIFQMNKIIDEISFQTNLLALNAAVEAARAGEAGKGFAVVAEEVRNLAMRSSKAAKEISDKVSLSDSNVSEGSQVAAEGVKSFESIYENIHKIESLIKEIAGASGEQSTGVSAINEGLNHLNGSLQESSSMNNAINVRKLRA